MSLIFPKWWNQIPYAAPVVAGVIGLGVAVGYWYYFTPDYWRVGYEPIQPVDYSHQLHAGTLGMDCRYCHTNVEESYVANVPATDTCMNCHTGAGEQAYLNANLWKVHKDNPNLVKVRTAYADETPIEWRKIHKVPDYAHFPHSVHLKAGVSCYSCHGRIDQQAVVRHEHSLAMGWCLDCHRNPQKHLVAYDDKLLTEAPKLTDLAAVEQLLTSTDQLQRGAKIAADHQLQPPQTCGACHY